MKKRNAFTPTKCSKVVRKMRNLAGFTLIEILIAVAIFSTAMIIASGIFSNIIGNQSLVTVSSDVNREGQRILRQISDDTINATVIGTVATVSGVTVTVDQNTMPRGILFLSSQNAIVKLADPYVCVVPETLGCDYAGVVLFTNSGIKIYRYNTVSKIIEYGIDLNHPNSNQLLLTTGTSKKLTADYTFRQLNSDSVEIISNGFSGIYCYSSSCSQAPFIRIGLTMQTKDYAIKATRHRAKIDFRTMITGRSY